MKKIMKFKYKKNLLNKTYLTMMIDRKEKIYDDTISISFRSLCCVRI
jgi:hypothetical protein